MPSTDKPGFSSYSRQKRVIELTMMILGFSVVPTVLILLQEYIGEQTELSAVLGSVWELVFLCFLLSRFFPGLFRMKGLWRFRPRTLGWIVLGFASLIIISFSISGIVGPTDSKSLPFQPSTSFIDAILIGFRLIVAVAYEELFFRIYLVERMRSLGVGAFAASLCSMALFAPAHAYQGVPAILASFLLAGVLSYLWNRTRNVWVVTGAHLLYNSAVLILAFSLPSAVFIV